MADKKHLGSPEPLPIPLDVTRGLAPLRLEPDPPPGWHDLMALVRHGALRVEGDPHPFFAHLFWFKGAFALLRAPAGPQPHEPGAIPAGAEAPR